MSIKVTRSDGTSDVTYNLTQNVGGQWNFFNTSGAGGLSEPETLRIQHFMRPAGAKGTDRHQIVFQKAIIEDTSNNYLVGSVSLMITVPRSSEYTLAMVKDLIAQLTSYVNRTANLTNLVLGGTPEGDFDVTGPFNPSIA